MRAPATLLCALLAAAADAGAATAAPAEAEADADATTLDAVVVTARKKSEELQKLPMSVVALDAAQLRALGINNVSDLAQNVPGMQQQQLAITGRLTVRGVNSGDNNAFEQAVGVYLDGIYRGRMNQQHIGLFDLERIEVLKGPQVTLYGNSSIGGAVSAVSRRPRFEPGGDVLLRYGFEYEEPHVEAGFDAPLSDTLAVRVAGKWRDQGEGNWVNDYSGRTEPQVGEVAGRFSALWVPGDAWTVALRHERGDYLRDGHFFDVYKHVDGQGNPWPGSTFTGLDDRRLNAGNGAPFVQRESFVETDMDETMLDVQYRAGDYTVTALSGWSGYNYRQSLDVDISPATLVNVYQEEGYDQFSQELRIAGPLGEHAGLLAGLYYQDDSFRNDYWADFNTPALVGGAFGLPASLFEPLISPFSRHILLDQDTRQWAVFGNVDFALAESVSASLGFRYLDIRKDAQQAVRTASIDHADGFGTPIDTRWLDPALAPLLLADPAYLANPTTYVLVLPDGSTVAPVLAPDYVVGYTIVSSGSGVIHEFDDLSRREHHPMFDARIAWQARPDLLLYASWSDGAKGGGFDLLYEGGDRDEIEYDPEQADVFEIGLKKDWRNLRLNVAAYYGRYSDLQVSVYDGGVGFIVGNAASSVSQGIDAEFEWRVADGWRAYGSLAYVDFRYDEFEGANCSTSERLNTGRQLCDWSGDRAAMVPEFESIIALEHTIRLDRGWTLQNTLRWSYTGEHSTASDNEAQTRQPAYDLLDWRTELAAADDRWALALIGRNLTDEEYLVFTSVIPLAPGGAFASVRSRGRELALEWRWSF